MAGISTYQYGWQIHTAITSYSLNDIMSAKVELDFDLGALTPRMKAMLKNQFKRGYKLRNNAGKLDTVTRLLSNQFNLQPLPIISNVFLNIGFSQKNPKLEKFLKSIALLNGIKPIPNSGIYSWHKLQLYDHTFHNPKEINKLVIEFMDTNPDCGFNTPEQLQEVIDYLETDPVLKTTQIYE